MWRIVSAASVGFGVAFAVVLMSISSGVEHSINKSLGVKELRGVTFIDVGNINAILHALTTLITSAVIFQSAAATFIVGMVLMASRRHEIGVRITGGAQQITLVYEFAREMVKPVFVGAVIGELVGIVICLAIEQFWILPVNFTIQSLTYAFPVTIIIALLAAMGPAYVTAGSDPDDLTRKG